VTVLLDPTSTRPDSADLADPVTPVVFDLDLPDTAAAAETPAPALPAELAALVTRARRDRGSALALVHLLLERGWSASAVGAALGSQVGLTHRQIEALATVRRPRTSASDVADRLVASRRPLTHVPHPRRG
jgi:hypothetical protein